MKKEILFGAIILIVLVSFQIVSSEELVTEDGKIVDSKIQEIFDGNESEVRVIVRLKDNSLKTISGLKEERRALMRQKDEWFGSVIEDVLADLSKKDRENLRKDSRGFGGEITKELFDKLKNDERVGAIYMDGEVHATLDYKMGNKKYLVVGVGVMVIVGVVFMVNIKMKKEMIK